MTALVPALVLAICDWIAVATGKKRLEYVFKPLTLMTLIIVAFFSGTGGELSGIDGAATREQWLWIIAALVFSLAGDVFLMLPSDRFVEGLASFLIAHICYIAAFNDSFDVYPTYWVALLVGIVSGSVYVRVRRGIIEKGHRGLLVPVTIYVFAISVMVTAAVGNLFVDPFRHFDGAGIGLVREQTDLPVPAAIAVAVGAILFYVSDALIGWTRFVRDFGRSRLAIMVTYHLGQMGFVLYLLRS